MQTAIHHDAEFEWRRKGEGERGEGKGNRGKEREKVILPYPTALRQTASAYIRSRKIVRLGPAPWVGMWSIP